MNTRIEKSPRAAARLLRWAWHGAGLALVLQLVLGVTGIPKGLHGWIVGAGEPALDTVTYVVVLGGGGIPSESGLMRTYHAASLAPALPDAVFIVSLPADEEPEQNSVGRMKRELVLRGVAEQRIRMEHRALNTHEQAIRVRELLPPEGWAEPILLVTSPTHVRRSLLCFRRAGFSRVGAAPAFATGPEAQVGKGVSFRYVFWANLKFNVDVARELCGMAYYKLRGWI